MAGPPNNIPLRAKGYLESGNSENRKIHIGKILQRPKKFICWLMKCDKDRAESMKTVKLINTKCTALQGSVRGKYNYVHEHAL